LPLRRILKFLRGKNAAAAPPARPVARLHRIPREQHGISRRQISPNALRVMNRLHEAGYRACLVGGAVRDLLLGATPKDFDVATDARPEQIKRVFRNCRLIGRRFVLAHVMFGRETIEVATFRGMDDDGTGARHVVEGRIVRDNVYGSIEDDAIRRDFTLNALYYDVADRAVLDYVGGYEDALARRLRTIGDAEARYREDPVRMLRAVRLAAKLGLGIDARTAEPIPRLAGTIGESAPARLFEELLKLFMSGHASESFRALDAHGLLAVLFPPTFRALHQAADSADRRLVEAALASTDRRIAEDRPVTPAFLLAALLWPAAKRALSEVDPTSADVTLAAERAVARVLAEQTARIALPKRFALPMQEIWALQPRFLERRKRSVHKFLAHPRFRAAYDFLVLRGEGDPVARAHAEWWTEVQSADAPELDRLVNAPLPLADETTEPASATGRPRRKRRRRRRGGAGRGEVPDAPGPSR